MLSKPIANYVREFGRMPYLTDFLEDKDITPMGASSCVTPYNSVILLHGKKEA